MTEEQIEIMDASGIPLPSNDAPQLHPRLQHISADGHLVSAHQRLSGASPVAANNVSLRGFPLSSDSTHAFSLQFSLCVSECYGGDLEGCL